jgi:outer membrane lipoprotein-sorting protein
MSQRNDSHSDVPDLEPELQAAVWAVLSKPLDAHAIARVKVRAANAQAEHLLDSDDLPAKVASYLATSSNQRLGSKQTVVLRAPFATKSFLAKCLALAAGIVVVVGTAFMLQSPQSLYAEVIDQLRAARSFTYITHLYTEGNTKPSETKTMVAEDGRRRMELAGGTISISDSSSRVRLVLIKDAKRALVYERDMQQPNNPKNDQLAWLETLKAHGDKPDVQLGTKLLDGRSVEGFVAKQGQYAYTMWIDTESKKLVQVEHEMFAKGTSITKVVMTDFRFNEPLDESLFSFDVPAGYTVQKQRPVPKVAGGEESIVEALRGYTKRSEGKFPKSITEWGEWAVLFSADSEDGQPNEEVTKVMAHLGSILPFLVSRSKDDYQYLGAGKSLDDERCIVFWYRTEGEKFRAIYNDLSVSDVEKKDLP